MKLLGISIAALMATAAAPALAQDDEPDGEPNLEAIDLLFGDQVVTGGEDYDGDAAEEDAAIADDDGMDSEAEPPADEEITDPDEAVEAEEEREISDLTRALHGYEDCAIAAGASLIEQGYEPEQAGEQSVLSCSGARAAYVNAFYFELLPRYPGAAETEVRASAERLTQQTDRAVAALVAREAPNYQPPAEDEEEISE
ncbi:MAG: hypothetical protein RLN87_03050 [Parasphingopyxis sp.]